MRILAAVTLSCCLLGCWNDNQDEYTLLTAIHSDSDKHRKIVSVELKNLKACSVLRSAMLSEELRNKLTGAHDYFKFDHIACINTRTGEHQ